MFTQFRVRYPKGSLVTELSAIDHGKYIVRCLVQVEGTTLVTALAAAQTVELAEDQARSRALVVLGIDTPSVTGEKETPVATPEVAVSPKPTPITPKAFSDDPDVVTATLSEGLSPTKPTGFPEAARVSDSSSLSSVESRRGETADVTAKTPPIANEMTFTDEFSSAEGERSQEVEAKLLRAEKISPTPLNDVPFTSYSPNEIETDPSETPSSSTSIDFSDIIARTNVELKRLGWTNQQGRDYLVQTYGKRSRQLLTDGELLDFLHHLESEPTPD